MFNLYIFQISIHYIIAAIILTSSITIYTLYTSLYSLSIYDKSLNTFYSTLFLNTKQSIQEKIIPVKQTKEKKYSVQGFKFSHKQILKIVEIHILKKLIVANAVYEIQPITKHKNKQYILINFEMSLKCSFFQLIQLFETLEQFAITISDFSITPKSQEKSDINISFTAPAYEE